MAEKRRKFTAESREGAVRIVTETGKPVPEVAKDLGIRATTLASRVSRAKRCEKAQPAENDALIARLTAENAALNAALKKDNKRWVVKWGVWIGGSGQLCPRAPCPATAITST